jgi:L-aspartate oxidase
MAIAALLIATAAWRRRESRGGHYRSDHPDSDARQQRRSFFTLDQARALAREATEGQQTPVATENQYAPVAAA